MSTKGAHIPDWLKVPLRGITPAPSQDKGAGPVPTGNWRSIRPVYRDKMPPCNNACGTNEKIQGYLDLVKRGKSLDAYALIKKGMPFPSVTGRVCYHPCEQACNRGKYDEAISIRAVERFLGDLGLALSRDVVKAGPPNGKTVAVVVGSARDTARHTDRPTGLRGHDPGEIIESGRPNRGGIPDWVLPQDVLDREVARLVELGITVKTNTEVGKDVSWDDLTEAFRRRRPGRRADRAEQRPRRRRRQGWLFTTVFPFLRDIGMGKWTGTLGSRVAVIGGGNTAIDCAREALRQGAKEVTMITVERATEGDAVVPEDLHDMKAEGVELVHGRSMTAALGDGRVEALELCPAKFSRGGQRIPITIDRERQAERFVADSVIIAVGQRACSPGPLGFKNERGTIKIDRFGRLGEHEVLRRRRYRAARLGQPLMVVNAVGDGKRVAFNLDKVLRETSRCRSARSRSMSSPI